MRLFRGWRFRTTAVWVSGTEPALSARARGPRGSVGEWLLRPDAAGLAVEILISMKKLPLGVSGFADIRRFPGYLYVDKTRHLADLFPAHGLEKRHLFLARPRRFGKTLLVSTLEALFQGRRELFADTWIGQADHWDWERNRHAVLRLSLALRNIHEVGRLENALEMRLEVQAQAHGLPHFAHAAPDLQLERLVLRLANESQGQIVVLVDEYDMAVTENLGRAEVLDDILDVMRAFYGALKEQSDCIRHTFLTGITRFSRTGLFAGANHLTDLSFDPDVNTLLGFTADEMHGNPDLAALVERAATHLGCSPADLYAAMADHYDGYRFAPGGASVYNPYSVAGCLFHLDTAESAAAWSLDRLPRFWAVSGTPSVLQHVLGASPAYDLAQPSAADPRVLEDTHFDVRRPPLAELLYQSGYLTRRPAGPDSEVLDFPNREVKEAFTFSLRQWYEERVTEWLQAEDAGPTGYLAQLRRALRDRDAAAVQGTLSSCLGALPYVLRSLPQTVRQVADYEVFYQSLLYVLLQVLDIQIMVEAATPAGRLDLAVELDGRISILELKVAASPTAALKQAFLRDYAGLFRMRAYPVTVYGLQFDIPTHTIQACRTWDLGRYNAREQKWEHEPFPVTLAALARRPAAERQAYVAAAPWPEADAA